MVYEHKGRKIVEEEVIDEFANEDVYSEDGLMLLSEDEAITPEEEAFMLGYLEE